VARLSDFLVSIHPINLGTGNQEILADLVFSTLVDVDSDEVTIKGDLAKSWEASPDATVYTFHLDDRAVWSDGKPVTTDDVIFTIAWTCQNPDAFKQLGVAAFLETKGCEDVKGTTNVPSGLKKIDGATLEVTLANPDGVYLRLLAGAVYYIQPAHILSGMTAVQAETCEFCLGVPGKAIGSGPYDFSLAMSATGANVKAKKGYWKGVDGPVDEIVYKIQESNVTVAQLAAGELDLAIRVPPREGPGLANVAGLKQLNVPGVGIFAMNFNHNNTDKEFRQAVAYAVNRQQIIDQVLGGLATLNYTIPPGFKVYDDINPYDFDATKANERLAASSWDKGKTVKLLLLAEDPNFTITAPALQQSIQDVLGLKVELTALPTAPYVDRIAQTDDWDIYLSFGGSEGVGWYQSQQYYACGSGAPNNLKLTASRGECDYNALFVAGRGAVGAAQDAILHELALKLNDELPEIYLWQPNYLHVYSDRLGGGFRIYPNERESFQSVLEWTYAP